MHFKVRTLCLFDVLTEFCLFFWLRYVIFNGMFQTLIVFQPGRWAGVESRAGSLPCCALRAAALSGPRGWSFLCSGETQQRPCKVELPRGQGSCQGGVVTAVSTARWLPATMFLLRMLPLQTPPRGEAQPNGAVGPVPHRAGQLGVRGPREVGRRLRGSAWHGPLGPRCSPSVLLSRPRPWEADAGPGSPQRPAKARPRVGPRDPRDAGLRRLPCDCPQGLWRPSGRRTGLCRRGARVSAPTAGGSQGSEVRGSRSRLGLPRGAASSSAEVFRTLLAPAPCSHK